MQILQPTFSFNLNQTIKVRQVTVVNINGHQPCLVCVNNIGKVFIHDPHSNDSNSEDIQWLNLSQNITHISQATLDSKQRECIVLGSENQLILHDIQSNNDLFNKEIPEGINTIFFGRNDTNSSLIYVGGNCSIQGFNQSGEEVYWNVAGDNVTALSYCDIDKDNKIELIVGSSDNYIRVFKDENILYEIQEVRTPILIESFKTQVFAYALENGNIGIYYQKNRLWRAKNQHIAVSMVCMNKKENNGQNCLIVGWQNGRIDLRNVQDGSVIFKLNENQNIAKLLKCDYRMDGTLQILSVTLNGQVKGYSLVLENKVSTKKTTNVTLNDEMTKLLNQKNLFVQVSLIYDNYQNQNPKLCVCLIDNSAIIRGVIIQCDKLFGQECVSQINNKPSRQYNIEIDPKFNVSAEMQLKIIMSNSATNSQFRMIDETLYYPRFGNFIHKQNRQDQKNIVSSVSFNIQERIPRFIKWIEQSFILQRNSIYASLDKQLQIDFYFENQKTQQPLHIIIDQQYKYQCQIKTDSMELAGDIIQDLIQFMNLNDLESTAEFPTEMKKFQALLEQIKQHNSAKNHILGDIAESISNVKVLNVKAEDYRILNEIDEMKKIYSNIMIQNNKMITEMHQKSNNHTQLLQMLKQLNSMINKAGNLRGGAAKQRVVSLCRAAIKSKNFFEMIQVINTGKEN